jgi:hypothetical protein
MRVNVQRRLCNKIQNTQIRKRSREDLQEEFYRHNAIDAVRSSPHPAALIRKL